METVDSTAGNCFCTEKASAVEECTVHRANSLVGSNGQMYQLFLVQITSTIYS